LVIISLTLPLLPVAVGVLFVMLVGVDDNVEGSEEADPVLFVGVVSDSGVGDDDEDSGVRGTTSAPITDFSANVSSC
jgi:hypothetical protein